MKLASTNTWPAALIFLFILFFSTPWVNIDDGEPPGGEPVLARILFKDQSELKQIGASFDIWEVNHEQEYALVYLKPGEYQALTSQGYPVVIDQHRTSQIQDSTRLLPDQTGGIPGFPCYRTVEEMYTSMQNLAAAHPALAEWIDIGDSWEKWSTSGSSGYDLHNLLLTNKSVMGPKPKFYLMAAIHAREYATAELAARFAEHLVSNYGLDADITWMLDYYEVHITPISNPDGRKIAEAGVYWRKNVNNTDGCTIPNLQGTDLNRNSSFKWGLVGASQEACAETFRGSAPASEMETQAIQGYVSSIFSDRRGPADMDPAPVDTPGIFITLHSYGDMIFFPWAWTDSAAPNGTALQTLGRKFGYFSGYQVCQSGGVGCLYQSAGNSDDWAYGELGVPAYTFEIGTSFFESCSYFETSIIPGQISTLLFALKAARLPYQDPGGPESIDLGVSAQRIAPGAGLNLTFRADDTRFHSPGWGQEPSQNVAAARYSIDTPSWLSGGQTANLQPGDGIPDSPVEGFSAQIDTSHLSPGRHTIFVESLDADGSWGVPSAVFITIVPDEFQPGIDPGIRSGSSSPSTTLVYDFKVTNAGTQDDIFDIRLWGNTWPTSLSTNSVGPLIPGESYPITVKVIIPETAQLGDQDLTVIGVSSRSDSGQFIQTQIISTVREPMLFASYIAR